MPRSVKTTEVKNENFRAVLQKGRLELLTLPLPGEEAVEKGHEPVSTEFPDQGCKADISCMQLTPEFLVYGTATGSILYYYLDEKGPCFITEYSHCDGGITRVWPNGLGTRLLFEDDRRFVYLYNPLNDQVLLIPSFTGMLVVALWDIWDPHLFVLAEKSQTFVYVYSPVNVYSPNVSFLGAFTRPFSSYPVGLQNGTLTCQLENGVLENLTLPTHRVGQGKCQAKDRFEQNLALLHFKEAWTDAKLLDSPEVWSMLVKLALEQMELEIAMKACQESHNLTLLIGLNQIEHIEDRFLLSGHILLLLENYDAAQDAFLKSSRPEAACEMRCNLRHWDKAMELAKLLGLPSAGEIAREYGHLLEMRGDHRLALANYEDYLKSNPSNPKQRSLAQGGVARTSLHLGDLWKGRQMAIQCNNPLLYQECARLLEGLNLLQDAAEMYELGGQLERAAGVYISIKNYTKAQPLLDRIASPKLHIEYAKAMETDRKFVEAAAAFETAEDIDNAVRLQLGPLKNPLKAFSILHKTRSLEGAAMAAKFCKNTGDYENAIEFLIMQKRTQEASELAQQHDKMDVYTELVKDVASKDELLKLARYYETVEKYEKATGLFERCGETKQALRLYLHWGTATAIDHAIDMVGRLRCDALTSQLLDYLMGEMEGVEKGPQYLFRLHTVLGNYDQATKAALLIAHQEQEMGNYKMAHQQLLDFCKVLQAQQRRVPLELSKQLMLLHSYILVKTLIRLNDHRSSSRMLIRVARHISKFPAHVTPILISTVIECQRSGLKKTAFEYASMLMRPEFRTSISAAYKRKIENIVRKPEKSEEEEPLAPCPTCSLAIPETQLDCPACQCTIPVRGLYSGTQSAKGVREERRYGGTALRKSGSSFCVATGRHMVLGNWSQCPHCQFPALMKEFIKVIEVEKVCPMCLQVVVVDDIKAISNPLEDQEAISNKPS